MNYNKIRKNPKKLLSLTGFSLSEFEVFFPTFKYHWEKYHSHFTIKRKALNTHFIWKEESPVTLYNR